MENYVEQVAVEGNDFLLGRIGADFSKLPSPLEQKLAALKNPWALAGNGWESEARAAVTRETGRLNTPNVENSEKILDLALGMTDALHGLSWQGSGNPKVIANIDEFVHDIRGEIVHKGTTPGKLNKQGVEAWRTFFDSLVQRLDAAVANHLAARVGIKPW